MTLKMFSSVSVNTGRDPPFPVMILEILFEFLIFFFDYFERQLTGISVFTNTLSSWCSYLFCLPYKNQCDQTEVGSENRLAPLLRISTIIILTCRESDQDGHSVIKVYSYSYAEVTVLHLLPKLPWINEPTTGQSTCQAKPLFDQSDFKNDMTTLASKAYLFCTLYNVQHMLALSFSKTCEGAS